MASVEDLAILDLNNPDFQETFFALEKAQCGLCVGLSAAVLTVLERTWVSPQVMREDWWTRWECPDFCVRGAGCRTYPCSCSLVVNVLALQGQGHVIHMSGQLGG